ncbi:MAG: hypothetical protein LUC90_03190 [Lachnospiraceae bacterium]|nr:hypothetical protein [Lachnospiraceae bacterium]
MPDADTNEIVTESESFEETADVLLTDTETDDYSYGFTVNSWSSSSIFKKITQYSRNEDGTNTFTAEFLTTADEAWIDENITFTVENVMPPAYTNMFETMGVDVSTLDYTVSSVTSSKIKQYAYYGFGVIEPFTEDGPGDTTQVAVSGKTFTITSGMGVRAVKVSAIMDGEVVDCIYLGTSGYSVSTPHTESELDAELYRQVRIRIENQLWTDDMTNLQKLNALADYIKSSTRYPNTAATSSNYEVNAQFVADFSVDNGFYLYYNMFSDSNISYAMALQGGIVTCYAANILYDAAIEELGLTDIYTSDGTVLDQEGVYLGAGSLSSNPTNSSHVSLIYYDADGNKYYIDAQGKTAAGDYSANILPLTETTEEIKPVITSQPESVVVANAGDKATLTVEAEGEDLCYRWYYKKPGCSSLKATGVYTANVTVSVTEARNGREMYCVISDANGNSVITDTVTVSIKSVESTITIISQPESVIVTNEGDKATLTVEAQGEDLCYSWYYKNPGGSTFKATGTTTASVTVAVTTARDGREMYCVITDANGSSVTTDTVTLSIGTAESTITIITQPESVTVANAGDKATLTVEAEGDDLSYCWYYKNPGSSIFKESGIYTSSVTVSVTTARDGREMYCLITDMNGNSVVTNTVTLGIN